MLQKSKIVIVLFLSSFVFIFTGSAFAHCDSMNGPVVKASRKALETGNLNYVLVWVRAEDENEIKTLFDKVNMVRALNEDAKDLADMYFYETVVRIHRMGEGVGYTGLKSAEFKPEEGIEAADLAIENNNINEILTHLDESQHAEVEKYFADLQSKNIYDVDDVTAGREYVESYVHFIHHVESLYSSKVDNSEEDSHHH